MIKKHLKPKNNGGTGEIIETEAPIHRSNVKKVEEKSAKKETKKKEEKKETKTTKKSTKKAEK